MKVLVCGGRNFHYVNPIHRELRNLLMDFDDLCIVEGGARGVDRVAGEWAAANGVPLIRMPAHWDALGKPAGIIRNGWMIKYAKPDLILAFPGGEGTRNMLNQATKVGIPKRIVRMK